MAPKILFGPAGIATAVADEGTAAGVFYCREVGLGAMEVEFVHGVNMKEDKTKAAGEVARKEQVRLSCHAPYYINMCAKEKPKIYASINYIVSTAQAAFWLGASPIVIHTGFYMERTSAECKKLVYETYEKCLDEMEKRKIGGVVLGAELTGKKSAYGDLDEIIDLAQHFGLKSVMPVIDYAHFHAREKQLKTKEDYLAILERVERGLGSEAAKNFHCHFSGIEFTDKGERNHLPVASNSPPFAPLAESWKENGWSGTVICESPLVEKDALALQKVWRKISGLSY